MAIIGQQLKTATTHDDHILLQVDLTPPLPQRTVFEVAFYSLSSAFNDAMLSLAHIDVMLATTSTFFIHT